MKKLVRDKIVDIISLDTGKTPAFKILSQKDYLLELKNKAIEEALEIKNTKNRNQLIEEIADLQEVIDCLCYVSKISKKELVKTQKQKRLKKGSFKKKLFLF